MGGRTQLFSASPGPLLPLIKEGKLKPLVVSSLKRVASLPDVPTLHETVAPNFEVGTWGGLMAPAKTPLAVIGRLQPALEKYFRTSKVSSELEASRFIIIVSGQEEYAAYIKSELERWGKVIRGAGIKPE